MDISPGQSRCREAVLPGGQGCGGARGLNINGANENDNNEYWISVSVLFRKMFTAAQFWLYTIYNDKHYCTIKKMFLTDLIDVTTSCLFSAYIYCNVGDSFHVFDDIGRGMLVMNKYKLSNSVAGTRQVIILSSVLDNTYVFVHCRIF